MGAFDLAKGLKEVPQSSLDSIRTQVNTELNTQRQQANSYGTPSDSTSRVNKVGKTKAKSLLNGGLNAYTSEINPTDFIPDPNKDNTTQTPDFYRYGRIVKKTIQQGTDITEVTVWDPVPEVVASVSDDYTGVLASIRLVDPTKVKPNEPGSTRDAQLIPEFSKFFLDSVQEAHQERFQVVETFNDFYAFFHGEKPPIYTFSGYLLNLKNYNWKNEVMYYYENFWRGTKAAELGGRIFLTYNYQQIQGYILNISTNINALTDKVCPFSFSVLVTRRLFFNGTPDDNVVRDNLLPRTDTGFINAQASSFSTSLVTEFLQGKIPASGNQIITDAEKAELAKVTKQSAISVNKQKIASPTINYSSSQSASAQRASGLNLGLGTFGSRLGVG